MKLSSVISAASFVALSTAQRVVPVNFKRSQHKPLSVHRRATFAQNLNNNITGAGYYASVGVGTPPQQLDLILDTGSSDVWVVANDASLCSSQTAQLRYGYCLATHNPSDSSSYNLVSENSFQIRYADGSRSTGDYIKDDFHIAGTTIPQLQMGLGINTTVPTGIIGIGFPSNEAARIKYPNIIDLFQSQGLIGSQAYSLYLNDYASSTGTILFGGIDTEKYIGELTSLQIQEDSRSGDVTSFTIALSSFTMLQDDKSVVSSTQPLPVILDSGTTLTYLDPDTVGEIYQSIGAYDDSSLTGSGSGSVFVDCKNLGQNITLSFEFGSSPGPTINVPIDEMVFDNVAYLQSLGLELPRDLPFQDPCTFGIMASDSIYLLGDTFLRSAYVVYDLTNQQIALAQANLNSTKSNVIEITNSSSSIPDATGVASQVRVTQLATATNMPGPGSGGTSDSAAATGSSTVTVTGGSSSSVTVAPGSGGLSTGGSAAGSSATATGTGGTGSSTAASASSTPNAGRRSLPAPLWDAIVISILGGLGMVAGGVVLAF